MSPATVIVPIELPGAIVAPAWIVVEPTVPLPLEAWLSYYNEDRPHGVIGNKPPILLQNPGGTPSPPP
ncbi:MULTISPECIES: transposase [unclassified Bosea (in: a-proteobacteria)]|uniref:transposase n=1 Tax=unclassified Bosea (in: a-proteobacteria) TaxID=2653178 RepID=UPI0012EEECEF|nr:MULTISPECIES: transposase [unclassified Bosea (in: a-proteobacteria)]CAD5261155.1 hypothetical protein BOSE7B_150067 [Bosea sp. 7B]VXC29808.1 hypothetical protein BOSE127_180069 [Bosea sp. 127]